MAEGEAKQPEHEPLRGSGIGRRSFGGTSAR